MDKKTVALIPLRGGSKSIPLKNIKTMAGRPLCAWVLDAACSALGPENVFVSTDSNAIIDIVRSINPGVNIIIRPGDISTDKASTESVMLHFAGSVDFDTLITMQATSPLTTPDDIRQALRLFDEGGYDSLVTGVSTRRFYWTDNCEPVNYNPLKRPRRQDMDGWIMENGAFYITDRKILMESKCRLGGRTAIYKMSPDTAIEIDEDEDWNIAEMYLQKRKSRNARELLKDIKLLVVDIDGTMTDAGMYFSAKGEELKKFNTRDAQGLALVSDKGIDLAIITRENSPIVTARAAKLKIEKCHIGIEDKPACLGSICSEMGISTEHVAYIGDDVGDLECIKLCGFSACPADAVDAVIQAATYVCRHSGGQGAVREVCEMILDTSG